MKVGVIGPLPPLRGGISHYNASLINELRSKDIEVTAITFIKLYPQFLFPGSSEIDEKSPEFENSEKKLIAWNIGTWISTSKYLKELELDRLVVHLWHPFFVPAFYFIKKQLKDTELIVLAHNVLPHEKKWMGKLFNKYLFGESSKIIVGGSNELKILKEEFGSINGEVVQHPFYDKFGKLIDEIDQVTAKEKLDYKDDDFLIVHLGLIREYKGLDILIEALGKLENKNFKLLIAGEFYDDFDKYFNILLNQNLQFISRVEDKYLSDEEMALAFKAADIVVLPYKRATQSGIAMASLACGTPVIATRVGALPDVLKHEEFGYLIDPDNVEQLKELLEDLVSNNRTKSEELSIKIKEKCEVEFSWSKLAEAILEN